MKKLICFVLLLSCCVQITSGQRFHGQKVVGYVPYYGDPGNVDFSNLTHVVFSAIAFNADGSAYEIPEEYLPVLTSFVATVKFAGAKVLLSVAGLNLTAVGANPNATAKMADTLTKICQKYYLDGVDMDWEGLSTTEDSTSYKNIMNALSLKLKPANLLLVATVTYGNYWGQWFPDAALAKADWLQVMVYDQTGTWAASPFGNHASFQHLLDAESYWTGRGYSRNKLVMGVPFYGRKFSSSTGGEAPAVSYKDIVTQYPSLCDTVNQTPGTDYNFFNGPELIRKKTQYLIDHNFGGIMIWEMTQDATGDKSLHKQIVCTYQGSSCPRISCITSGTAYASDNDFQMYVANGASLAVQLNEEGPAMLQFYDLSGKLVQQSEIYISRGMNQFALPGSVKGLFIGKITMEHKVYSEKLYR